MKRIPAAAFLAFLSVALGLAHAGGDKSKDLIVKGVLTEKDPIDAQRKGPSKTHSHVMKAGTVYTIDMVSTEFDSYLRLLDPKGNQLDEDDDSGGNLHSRIIFNCTKDGEYKIVTTTYGPNAKGNYTLTVKSTGTVAKAATGHTQLVGKAAPDFQPDFALNGKASKLADWKGKVVLLYFWDPRSSACAAYLPKLEQWSRAHKADGLVVVGATFYPSEIGQRLGFDQESGGLKSIAKADKKSDQELFKAYAAHHKIEHLLLALSKQEALAAYDAYVVNGVPEVVVIDRQGAVRLIDVGGEKSSATVETEFKKHLGEK